MLAPALTPSFSPFRTTPRDFPSSLPPPLFFASQHHDSLHLPWRVDDRALCFAAAAAAAATLIGAGGDAAVGGRGVDVLGGRRRHSPQIVRCAPRRLEQGAAIFFLFLRACISSFSAVSRTTRREKGGREAQGERERERGKLSFFAVGNLANQRKIFPFHLLPSFRHPALLTNRLSRPLKTSQAASLIASAAPSSLPEGYAR